LLDRDGIVAPAFFDLLARFRRRCMGKTARKRKTKIKTIPWDSAAYLKTEEDIANYLEAVFEDGDPSLITHAFGVIARAKGVSRIAKATGCGP
jgi:hypothetical protein